MISESDKICELSLKCICGLIVKFSGNLVDFSKLLRIIQVFGFEYFSL